MKYSIPFDKKLFIEQTKLTLPFIYADQYKGVKESIVLTLIFFLVGLIFLILGSEINILFFSVMIFIIYDLYWKYETYKSIKNNHINSWISFIEEEEMTSLGIFEFRDDCLRYSNDFYCTWIEWQNFKHFKVVKSHLLLIQKEKFEEIIVIGESEVNKTEFQKILLFVEEKINLTA